MQNQINQKHHDYYMPGNKSVGCIHSSCSQCFWTIKTVQFGFFLLKADNFLRWFPAPCPLVQWASCLVVRGVIEAGYQHNNFHDFASAFDTLKPTYQIWSFLLPPIFSRLRQDHRLPGSLLWWHTTVRQRQGTTGNNLPIEQPSFHPVGEMHQAEIKLKIKSKCNLY